ncbi:MAG: ATP-grasp domain-containing protein, partial [Woeseiaceae bacterium]
MRIGVIGAGQLGQMLGHAAADLGFECLFLDPSDKPPAASAGHVIRAAFDDNDALHSLAKQCDVITYEFENVEVAALHALGEIVPVLPPVEALRLAQDRLDEKRLFESVDIPLPSYRPVDSLDDLRIAASELGLPIVVKTRRFGYDGKGQFVVRTDDDIDEAWRKLQRKALIAEVLVPFDFEVSIFGARDGDGKVVTWPLTCNVHTNGVLRT